ncbi:hypothetical protein [Rhodanobacter denitrificans]|nr:hypothetical protein [Rhodanobacter denitrificans]
MHAHRRIGKALRPDQLLAPAKSAAEMQRIVTNNYVDMVMTGLFMLLVVTMVLFCLRALINAWQTNHPTAHEEPYVALSSVAG